MVKKGINWEKCVVVYKDVIILFILEMLVIWILEIFGICILGNYYNVLLVVFGKGLKLKGSVRLGLYGVYDCNDFREVVFFFGNNFGSLL